ncbi:hypothetical protein A3G63_02065 [Candidatus Kaiserbacteria bacterium RIFCSPLOWO2_12_FULL_52_8]|nr:MAG: hypothetical protein A3G63_02065 [Candidatus Kaiserbacteria bacterium RIFCSPLOWO2_12_FULL_52_8]
MKVKTGDKKLSRSEYQKLNTLIKNQSEETRRYVGAISENFTDNVRGIAEMVIDTKKDIKTIKQTLDSHTEMIGQLMVDVTELKTDVSVLKSDVSIIKTGISVLKTDVATLKSDVSELKTDMKEVKRDLKQKVAVGEFRELKQRVALV